MTQVWHPMYVLIVPVRPELSYLFVIRALVIIIISVIRVRGRLI